MSLKGIRSRFRGTGGADSDQGSPSRSSFFHQLASFLGPDDSTKGSTYSQEVFIHTLVFPRPLRHPARSALRFDGAPIILARPCKYPASLSPSPALVFIYLIDDDQHRIIYTHK